MINCSQLTVGMVIRLEHRLFKVESVAKVSIAKAKSFMKVQLCDLQNYKVTERKLKTDQEVQEVALNQCEIEFLYPEDRGYTFLDIRSLEQLFVDKAVVGNKINYLKEGVQVIASTYGGEIYAVELPQFLELMVAQTQDPSESKGDLGPGEQEVILETGAKIIAPLFIEEGDVIKVDTRSEEFIQRV